MKILVVCSGNYDSISPFISEQAEALNRLGISTDFFLIKGSGYFGYIKNLVPLVKKINEYNPQIIHAHFGLSALLANLQRKVPVISTFHGSDIWIFRLNRILSYIAHQLSHQSIIVDARMADVLGGRRINLIPCSVDMHIFFPVSKELAIRKMELPSNKINILFSSRFDNFVKNYSLAKKVMNVLGDEFNLVELKGYSREKVNLMLNACDLALMTSISEGSPQFIKEAMACNCTIVSTYVGDVQEILGNTEGCYICKSDPLDIAGKIKMGVEFARTNGQTTGRQRIVELKLDKMSIARRIELVYKKVLSE